MMLRACICVCVCIHSEYIHIYLFLLCFFLYGVIFILLYPRTYIQADRRRSPFLAKCIERYRRFDRASVLTQFNIIRRRQPPSNGKRLEKPDERKLNAFTAGVLSFFYERPSLPSDISRLGLFAKLARESEDNGCAM